jgi:hypothetical protein
MKEQQAMAKIVRALAEHRMRPPQKLRHISESEQAFPDGTKVPIANFREKGSKMIVSMKRIIGHFRIWTKCSESSMGEHL